MGTLRHVLLALFFFLLAGLEIGHGLWRISASRSNEERRLLEELKSRHARLGESLAGRIEAEREHALHLARTPVVGAFLEDPSQDARSAAQRLLLPYLASFSHLDCILLLDAQGRETLRCQRIGGGVGCPAPESERRPGVAQALLARNPSEDAVLMGIENDPRRVEVPPSERKVLCYAASVREEDQRLGAVVVCTYSSSFFAELRAFEPLPGVASELRSSDRALLERSRTILEDRDEVAQSFESRLDGAPGWSLWMGVPKTSLAASSDRLEAEVANNVVVMIAVTALLALAAGYFVRLSVREVSLLEERRHRQREAELEERLRTSERLSSLGLLTAGVAHEINNPLEGIGNYLALLENEGLPPERRVRFLAAVKEGFQRIRSIVKDLSGLARPEIRNGRAELRGVLERAARLSGHGGESSRPFTLHGVGATCWIQGDPGRLEQLFINLFLNARNAMGEEGVLGVAVDSRREDGLVEVRVEDEGPGVPSELRERIFDPFFTTGEGSGLGLTIAYRIVQAHASTLKIEEAAGGGASFRFTLRRCEESEGESA